MLILLYVAVFANVTVLLIGPLAVCFEMWIEVVFLKHRYVELVSLVLC